MKDDLNLCVIGRQTQLFLYLEDDLNLFIIEKMTSMFLCKWKMNSNWWNGLRSFSMSEYSLRWSWIFWPIMKVEVEGIWSQVIWLDSLVEPELGTVQPQLVSYILSSMQWHYHEHLPHYHFYFHHPHSCPHVQEYHLYRH